MWWWARFSSKVLIIWSTLLHEMEVIPLRVIGESAMVDVEAILNRRPQVCLIDELARENPPEGRNRHRWQDVEEILAAGINVVPPLTCSMSAKSRTRWSASQAGARRTAYRPVLFQSADELVIVDVPAEEMLPESEATCRRRSSASCGNWRFCWPRT